MNKKVLTMIAKQTILFVEQTETTTKTQEVRIVTEITRATEKELQEVHEDISVIAQKKPEMMPILIGVIKGMRLSSEASENNATS